jgi:hypothetical protein
VGGTVNVNYADDVVPDGWVAYDPYTYCTYCPKCWEGIEAASVVRALGEE